MPVTIERVATKKQLKEFVKLPYALYRNDPNWVPQLRMDDSRSWTRTGIPSGSTRPVSSSSRAGTGRSSGRIAAIHDRIWEETHDEKAAYWGWFECVDDAEAARGAVRRRIRLGARSAAAPASSAP